MLIKSNVNGQYRVEFIKEFAHDLKRLSENEKCYFIVDKNVSDLYSQKLSFLSDKNVYLLKAVEKNKTIAEAQSVIEFLLKNKFKRNHKIVAVGGGITQDVTCFVASVLFRGVKWVLYPTTLLAQCDSCIGSKSSINVGEYKNQVGTFYPPERIAIDTNFISTLQHKDILSGIGEAIKVHYLDPLQTHSFMIDKYESCFKSRAVMEEVIKKSLAIKKKIIEVDEYDKDYRNILNYGHTFGHALESATDYVVPHGVAVTIGMDISNYVSHRLGHLSLEDYDLMKPLLKKNMKPFESHVKELDCDLYWSALRKDKKNIDGNIGVILTKGPGQTFKTQMSLDESFKNLILEYVNKF